MKRFKLFGPDLTAIEQEIWRQARFDDASAEAADIAWLENTTLLMQLLDQRMMPKILLLKTGASWVAPDRLQAIYTMTEYGKSPNGWLVGTKMEAPLPDDVGTLLCEQNMEALSETLYDCLLRDVFRETADWCGHMSSVVGRM
ncbi:MAG: hypothetical protein AB9917_07325 [Negativicutes bacterium]